MTSRNFVPTYGNGRAVTCGSALRDRPAHPLAGVSDLIAAAESRGYDRGYRDGLANSAGPWWLHVAILAGGSGLGAMAFYLLHVWGTRG